MKEDQNVLCRLNGGLSVQEVKWSNFEELLCSQTVSPTSDNYPGPGDCLADLRTEE